MVFDPNASLPFITAEWPGIGGRLREVPEDFEVEEIPAYEPSGAGEFLYLWIEKRDLGAEYFARRVAQRLGIRPDEIGMAGLKDRRAVTRQWVSVPLAAEGRLKELEGDGIRLLHVGRHTNKLRPGHLRGNRFRIRVRDVNEGRVQLLPPMLLQIARDGLPNLYGEQRFGREGETLALGFQLLHGERPSLRVSRFLRKLALSAVQSALFNHYLARRMRDGLLHAVLPGDVMAKWPAGGMFRAEDVAAEQARFDARETVSAGPIFGRKMFPADGVARQREEAVLAEADLTSSSFAGFGKLLQGTRRHNVIYIDDLHGEIEGSDAVLSFTLPAGSYATVLLREVMKPAESGMLTDEAPMANE